MEISNNNKLIAGLGNPGMEYSKTRHNIGFTFLDYFLENINRQTRNDTAFRNQKKFKSDVAILQNRKTRDLLVLAKPSTFMNKSGESIKELTLFYKIAPENLLVVHDDLDLPLGSIKISQNRGSGGHNGIRSIMNQLGTKEFSRVRIGISTESKDQEPGEKFVLGKFSKQEQEIINAEILNKTTQAVENFIEKGLLFASSQSY